MTIYDYVDFFHISLDRRHRNFTAQLSHVRQLQNGGAYWDKALKAWHIPGNLRQQVLDLSAKFKAPVYDPFAYVPNFNELPILQAPDIEVPVPEGLEARGYQLQGVGRGMELKRFINGDEQGLGKTIQTILTLVTAEKAGHEVFPHITVCPSSMKENWRREWHKWSDKKAIVLTDATRLTWANYIQLVGRYKVDVLICNYESLRKYFVAKMPEKRKGWHSRDIEMRQEIKLIKSVAIDELHRCKDGTTIQSKVCSRLTLGKDWRIGMTGTAVVNKPTDLYSQLVIIGQAGHFGNTLEGFKNRYCGGPDGASNLKELNWLLNQHCYFRREKKEVAKDLPAKERQKYHCSISNMDEYRLAETKFREFLKRSGATQASIDAKMRAEVLVQMTTLKQIAERGKMAEVKDFVQEVLDGGNKLILFATLTDTVAQVKKLFPHAVTVTGADNDQQKQRNIDRFQTDPTCQLIVCNVKAAGVGITLTASSRVGFIGWPWTYADCVQCEDRAHRIGQENNVTCTYFLADDTIDEDLYDLVQSKREMANTITGNTDEMEMATVDRLLTLFRTPKTERHATDPDPRPTDNTKPGADPAGSEKPGNSGGIYAPGSGLLF